MVSSAKDAEYRLLNLELLQTGLAKGKNVDGLRYTEICTLAYNKAIDFKLKVYSNEEDPKYYYGDAIETDIKYLRTHIDEVNGKRVAFTELSLKKLPQIKPFTYKVTMPKTICITVCTFTTATR